MNDKPEKSAIALTQNNLQIVSFNLGKEEFALNIGFIQEIIKMQTVTPVPLTPDYVEGVMNIRGNIIPLVNLRLKMDFNNVDITPQTRIIVLNIENRRIGLIVDSMNEVIRVPADKLHNPPAESAGEDNDKNIESLCILEDRIISLLNIQKILEIN